MRAFAESTTIVKHAVKGRNGVVAAQNRKAAAIGAAILEVGGDAVDAALATSFALGASEPWMSGLGGGATMILYRAAEDRAQAIDGGMVAPKALDPAAYPLTGEQAGDLFGWPRVLEDRNLIGPMSFAVPGGLAALGLAHERFGRVPLPQLVAPARKLAEEGLELDWFSSLLVASGARDLARFPSSAAVYLPDGLPPMPAEAGIGHLRLARLADSLGLVAEEGTGTLYKGGLAELVAQDLKALASPLGAADLAAYAARASEPLAGRLGSGEVFAMPGLFAGGTLLGCLKALAGRGKSGRPDADAYRAYVEVVLEGYARRLEREGHAAEDGPAPSCTSHVAVVDKAGNMVSLTQTLLSLFGSKVVLPGSGILMNNGVMWFDPRPGRPNSMAPGARPLSNMCPVIARDGTRRLALGASGGRRIMPAVMQILSFVLDHGMTLEEAFAQGRIDVTGEGAVTMNRVLAADVQAALGEAFAAEPVMASPYPMRFACPVAVLHDLALGEQHGTAEPAHPWADAVAAG